MAKQTARVKDKVRKPTVWPAGGKSGTFDGGHGGTTSPLAVDDTKPYKKKPARKGRPDGS